MNRIIPYTITSAALTANPDLMMQFSDVKIGRLTDYEARQPIEIDADKVDDDPCLLGDIAWSKYQNIDEDWQTPDGGRSMMTGDLVKVELDGKPDTWLIVMAVGFKDVTNLIEEQTRSEISSASLEDSQETIELERRRKAYQGFAGAFLAPNRSR